MVDSRGLIVTNTHVAQALQKRPTKDVFVAFFTHMRDENDRVGVGAIFRNVTAWFGLNEFIPVSRFFGETPDMEFVGVDLKGLTELVVSDEPYALRMGVDIVTIGFPSGRDRLVPSGGPVPKQLHPFCA